MVSIVLARGGLLARMQATAHFLRPSHQSSAAAGLRQAPARLFTTRLSALRTAQCVHCGTKQYAFNVL